MVDPEILEANKDKPMIDSTFHSILVSKLVDFDKNSKTIVVVC